ncbi:hypothetical protein COB52_03295 [Candidatus Kaiserbacteria bacterium]|nr:MAG: hypothetical protein COB52_03295 [Candidatus Kaiserbacteria bacterium]
MLLITRPRYDTATHYLYHWTKEIIDEADTRGIDYKVLNKDEVKKKVIQSYLKKGIAHTLLINGHGSATTVCGHEDKVLISSTDGVQHLKGVVIFARACKAAQILGPKAIEKGARAFIGYIEDFIFLHQSDKESEFFKDPTKDNLAKPFMECSNKVSQALIKGHSPSDAHEQSQKLYRKYMREMLNSEAESYALPYLLANMQNQVCLESAQEDI